MIWKSYPLKSLNQLKAKYAEIAIGCSSLKIVFDKYEWTPSKMADVDTKIEISPNCQNCYIII